MNFFGYRKTVDTGKRGRIPGNGKAGFVLLTILPASAAVLLLVAAVAVTLAVVLPRNAAEKAPDPETETVPEENQPEETAEPAPVAPSDSPEKPEETPAISAGETEQSQGGAIQPVGDDQPGGNTQPGGDDQPGGNTQPGGDDQPGGDEGSGGTIQPSGGESGGGDSGWDAGHDEDELPIIP